VTFYVYYMSSCADVIWHQVSFEVVSQVWTPQSTTSH